MTTLFHPEVLTMGRISVDIYPLQIGVSLREVSTFGKFLGGSATNVAVAAARYGRRAAVITRTGHDPFGEFLHDALRGYGVDDRYVTPVDGLPTPVTFCEIFPPDDFPLYFYRLPKAPDLRSTPTSSTSTRSRPPMIFWVTVTGLSAEPSREATLTALRGPGPPKITVLDLDYRPMFWPSRGGGPPRVQEALPFVTVAAGNLDENETAVGNASPERIVAALHERGVRLAIVKQGPAGVLASDGTQLVGSRRRRWRSSMASVPATLSAGRCATACCPAGIWNGPCASATRPARSWPRSCLRRRHADRPIRSSASWRRRHMSDERFRALIEARVASPSAIAEAARPASRPPACSASTAS